MTGKRGIWPVNVRRIWTGTAALLLLLTAAACAPRPAQLEVLTIGTADSGGTMYPVGRAIAGAMASETRKLNVGASTGSEKNIADLSSGEIDLGLVTADAAYDAVQAGTAEGLRAIGAVYVSVSTWLAPADSGLLYVHDMTTERLGVGPENSVTEQTAQVSLEVLKTDGVSPTLENCSLEQGWRELAEGKLDAVHGFVGTPAEGLVNLSQQLPCNVLRYTQEELEQILGANKVYCAAVIPAESYVGQVEEVPTFGSKCLLCVDASMDEELVYALTQALWQARDTLKEEHPALAVLQEEGFLWEGLPVALHEGAERFYQENCPGFEK